MTSASSASVANELDFADSVAAYLMDQADSALANGDNEHCLRYTHVAATVLSRQNRVLFSPRVESSMRSVSERLFHGASAAAAVSRRHMAPQARLRSLHVLSEALPAGGLTAMATRWIASDAGQTEGHVALLTAGRSAPQALTEAVVRAGGAVHIMPAGMLWTEQARWLRELARRLADCVVLHIDVSDVVCGAAFGSAGGPPVILVNHNAHIFWTGVSYADRIANCRGSDLEAHWTSKLRGAPRGCFVPIPIVRSTNSTDTGPSDAFRPSRGVSWRASAGIPSSAVVLVSVGSRFKYSALPDSDFVETLTSVLLARREAYLVVVGFEADARWASARARTEGRIRILGRLTAEQLNHLYLAADIYVEGFPFGTTTALLEAASNGVACVVAPIGCPPPYATDGAAIDGTVPRSGSSTHYKRHLHHLIVDAGARFRHASRVRESVIAHHVGAGWKQHLETAMSGLPDAHAVYDCGAPASTPLQISEHWARFSPMWTWPFAETLEHSIVRALTLDLMPRLDRAARTKLAAAGHALTGRRMPLWLIALLCQHVLPRLSIHTRLGLFRVASFASRPGLWARLRDFWSRAGATKEGAYTEYRVKPRVSD